MSELPKLEPLFFNVCYTAIKNTAWKRSDFEKVQFVEGQLKALQACFATPEQEDAKNIGVKISNMSDKKEPEKKVEEPQPKTIDSVKAETEKKNSEKGVILDKDGKEVPQIPMPDSILEAAKVGVQQAKKLERAEAIRKKQLKEKGKYVNGAFVVEEQEEDATE